MTDRRNATPHDAKHSKRTTAARPTIRLERSQLLGSGDRTTAAKIGDGKGGGGGGGGGAPIRGSQ